MASELSLEYSMWQNEVCMALADRSIRETSDDVLGYRKIVGSELDELLKSAYFKKLTHREAVGRKCYYRFDCTGHEVIGCIWARNYTPGGFDVAVFAVPPEKKRLKQVLYFNNLRSPFTARLALGILFQSFAHNDFNIKQFSSEEFATTIKSFDSGCLIAGLYRTFDDRYHCAVTFDVSQNCGTYHTYYFKKGRGGYDMTGEDLDFPTLVHAMDCMARSAREAAGDDEYDDCDDFSDDDFGFYGNAANEW